MALAYRRFRVSCLKTYSMNSRECSRVVEDRQENTITAPILVLGWMGLNILIAGRGRDRRQPCYSPPGLASIHLRRRLHPPLHFGDRQCRTGALFACR